MSDTGLMYPNDESFRYVNDGTDVSITIFESENEKVDLVFVDMRNEVGRTKFRRSRNDFFT